MKFLLHGNAPTVKTGYGVQLAQLGEQLREDGHQPAFSSTYGIEGGIEGWRGLRVYGRGYEVSSNDRLHLHADHFFAGEPGWIIACIDVFAMQNPLLAEYNVAAWCPVDHFPAPPSVVDFFHRTGATPIAMSRYGERLLFEVGLDPVYIPLTADTTVYKPTAEIGGMTAREMCGLPEDAFVVGMVGMNKGWSRDRKGFNEAFRAFGLFEQDHPDAYLYVHAERFGGAEGINLVELAAHAGIPEHKLVWSGGPNQYGYFLTFSQEMMAAMYTSFDVLLAPSHGEGFCVPLIEAQACGTPVIVTDFSAQPELVGAGWTCEWQWEWNPALHASFVVPLIDSVLEQLENSYDARGDEQLSKQAVEFAADYDTKIVYEKHWRPFLASLDAKPDLLPLDRQPMPDEDAVAVICPIYRRTSNVADLSRSFLENTPKGAATLYFVTDDEDQTDTAMQLAQLPVQHRISHVAASGDSCATKWNDGYQSTTEPWVLLIGDDVRFHEGWLDEPRKLSAEFDVIGTNDTADKPKNPFVARGIHADHFFVRRAYVEEYGACLEGPGVLAPEVYRHFYTDTEIVKLARARGTFTPCLDSIVEHLHPGYDGREDLREADPTYMTAVEFADQDRKTWADRLPLVEIQRTTRGRV